MIKKLIPVIVSDSILQLKMSILFKIVGGLRPAIAARFVSSTSSSNNSSNNINTSNRPIKKSGTTSTKLRDPVRQVYISQSTDVFTNLALEDWLYRKHDFDHKSLLLLWQNDPCVVIGRHQNPWVETNVPFLRESYTKLARRNSGGGTVYHDLGNLNCTFFTRRSAYDRRRNLEVVCSAIKAVSNLNVSVNDRDDIVFNATEEDKKVSGTAAKLGRETAYHHCTVLVDVNECVLHDALSSGAEGVESRATQSVRVPVKNLSELCPKIRMEDFKEALGWIFLRTNVDGQWVDNETLMHQRGFQMVRPEEVWYPGIDKLREEFESAQWIFGKTPKFKVCRVFAIPDSVLEGNYISGSGSSSQGNHFHIELSVVKGRVESVTISSQHDKRGRFDPTEVQHLVDSIQGLDFGPQLWQAVMGRLQSVDKLSSSKKQFFTNCVYTMTHKFA